MASARARSSASSRSRSSSPSSSPARPGEYVKLEDTIKGFQEILDGKHDDLPEQAFYMVGTIDDAVEKGRSLRGEDSGSEPPPAAEPEPAPEPVAA